MGLGHAGIDRRLHSHLNSSDCKSTAFFCALKVAQSSCYRAVITLQSGEGKKWEIKGKTGGKYTTLLRKPKRKKKKKTNL